MAYLCIRHPPDNKRLINEGRDAGGNQQVQDLKTGNEPKRGRPVGSGCWVRHGPDEAPFPKKKVSLDEPFCDGQELALKIADICVSSFSDTLPHPAAGLVGISLDQIPQEVAGRGGDEKRR